jgi:hypothetical protein
MTSDICSNKEEKCILCHKTKEKHFHWFKLDEYWCVEDHEDLRVFTPSPKSKDNSHPEEKGLCDNISTSSGSDNTHTLAEIEQRIRKGCGERGKFDGRGFWICGLTQIDEGTYYCQSCQAQLSLCKEFKEMINSWYFRLRDKKTYVDLSDVEEIVGVEE